MKIVLDSEGGVVEVDEIDESPRIRGKREGDIQYAVCVRLQGQETTYLSDLLKNSVAAAAGSAAPRPS